MNRLWVVAVALAISGPCAALAASGAGERQRTADPEILSPKVGDSVPRLGKDPACAHVGKCTLVNVSAQVPEACRHPVLAVGPLNLSPRIWIQPPIISRTRGGRVEGAVYLGTPKIGKGEKYAIYVLCGGPEQFKEGDVIEGIPEGLVVSDPVTVFRTE